MSRSNGKKKSKWVRWDDDGVLFILLVQLIFEKARNPLSGESSTYSDDVLMAPSHPPRMGFSLSFGRGEKK